MESDAPPPPALVEGGGPLRWRSSESQRRICIGYVFLRNSWIAKVDFGNANDAKDGAIRKLVRKDSLEKDSDAEQTVHRGAPGGSKVRQDELGFYAQ